jgi:Tfp pilus assembly protein PilN
MSQQINLFNPLFRKKGFSFTSATAMLYGVGIVFGVMAMAVGYAEYDLRATQTAARSIDADYKAAVAQREKLTTELAQQKPNVQLEKELSDLDAILRSRQEIVDTLKGGAIGNTRGFSDYMLAFSRQSVSGLWLTGFDIALAGNELAIQGRTLSADMVAKYLARLNQEKALNGRQFGVLRINRQTQAPAAAAESAQKGGDAVAKAPVARTPPYLEFSISTIDLAETSNAVSKAEPVPPPLMGAISVGALVEAAKAGNAKGAQK